MVTMMVRFAVKTTAVNKKQEVILFLYELTIFLSIIYMLWGYVNMIGYGVIALLIVILIILLFIVSQSINIETTQKI